MARQPLDKAHETLRKLRARLAGILASAQVFRITPLAAALRDATGQLQAGQSGALGGMDLGGLGGLLGGE